MDAIFIDQAGHKKNFLYQYDVGQSFVIENFEYSTAPKVQFQIKSLKTSPSVGSKLSGGNLTVPVPDMLLTYGEDLVAYLYIQDAIKGNVIETVFISVIPRKYPANYQYTSETFACTVNGTTISENPSFGETAIWADGNPNNENRDGYFVTASYGSNSLTISKTNSINNVYGVATNNVGFAANCTENKLDASGNLLPKYAYVCTSGFVEVIDNGRCAPGKMCIPYTDGTARTATNTIGYKVIARTDSKHIIIFVDVSMQIIDGFQTSITNFSSHLSDTSNPHSVTQEQVGLGNCDNTSDADKPISTATQTALNKKADLVDGVVPLSQLPSQVKEMRVVDNITARDAITDKFANLRVYVKDATADSTVQSGGADYLYDGTTWIKTGETESLDLVLNWDNVGGKPSNYTPSAHASTHFTGGSDAISPSDIGAATADHTHDASVIPIVDEVTGTKYYFKMINGVFGLYAENSDVNVLNGDNTSY